MSGARPEQAIQRAVIQHLQWRGVPKSFFFHPANGGFRTATEAAVFKSLGVVAGTPDLILLRGGKPYGLELKSEHGRLSPAQSAVHAAMTDAGATVATAVGIDAALAQLGAWGFLR
jgi:hypothetical protein